MSDRDDEVYLDDCLVLKETDRALLVEYEGQEEWLPRSQLLDGTDIGYEGDCGAAIIPRWLADERGLS